MISLLLATVFVATTPVPTDCTYDFDAMLALDRQAFDQDMGGGWRVLADRGCDAEAAELIREWRHEKRDHASILYWHEGQLRALAGQTREAIALFQLTYKAADDDADFGWNHYVDGTIAFLRRDRDGLAVATRRLADLPPPTSSSWYDSDAKPLFNQWPPNLPVLKAFERCWDRDYKGAYGEKACFEPTG